MKAELDELEQEQLEGELAGAHAVPVHSPSKVDDRRAFFLSLCQLGLMHIWNSSRSSYEVTGGRRRGRGIATVASDVGHVVAIARTRGVMVPYFSVDKLAISLCSITPIV